MRNDVPALKRGVDVLLPAGFSQAYLEGLVNLLDEIDDGSFKVQYLKSELFSKYCDSTTTPATVRRENAIDKWLSTELRNSRTNRRLQLADDVNFGWTTWERFRKDVRAQISSVLGECREYELLNYGVHTNGASPRVKRSPSAALEKLSGEVLLSSTAVSHWFTAFSGTLITNQTIKLHETSTLFTVPKKSDIDRVACKEPEGNMLLQRCVGNYIRDRLKVFGINLRDQTVNQRLAQKAVAFNLATVDLSAASDSITRQLVIELLPFEWWSLLDDLRVKSCIIPKDGGDELHELEMFSSMGNGFTFELETLIFWAIVRTVCKHTSKKGRISVYGDDIICPNGAVRFLKQILGFMGFTLNAKKTHNHGLFRESCGRHYYGGFDVSPFYVREEIRTLPHLINQLNLLLEWEGRGWGFFTSEVVFRFWSRWASFVPPKLWGGISPDDPTCLVTGHSPRHRLLQATRCHRKDPRKGGPLTDDQQRLDNAAYVHWHMQRIRPNSVELAVDPSSQTGFIFRRVVSLGERTSWTPNAICEGTPEIVTYPWHDGRKPLVRWWEMSLLWSDASPL